jgi:hypothetical protein
MKETESLKNSNTYYIIYLIFIMCGLFNNVHCKSPYMTSKVWIMIWEVIQGRGLWLNLNLCCRNCMMRLQDTMK